MGGPGFGWGHPFLSPREGVTAMDKEEEARLNAMYEAWIEERQRHIDEEAYIEWLIEYLDVPRSDL